MASPLSKSSIRSSGAAVERGMGDGDTRAAPPSDHRWSRLGKNQHARAPRRPPQLVARGMHGMMGPGMYGMMGLGMNPSLAHEALKLEDKVGTMLPCNVIVQVLAPGRVEVAAIDPVASMAAIDNPALLEKAQIVRSKLEKVINSL